MNASAKPQRRAKRPGTAPMPRVPDNRIDVAHDFKRARQRPAFSSRRLHRFGAIRCAVAARIHDEHPAPKTTRTVGRK